MGEQRYEVRLTWDEMDEVMAALRERAWHLEDRAGAAESVAEQSEWDQGVAAVTLLVHRFGDARRGVHGEPLVLTGADGSFDELLEDE